MKNMTIAAPTTGMTSRPALRRAALRVRPLVIIQERPSRKPGPGGKHDRGQLKRAVGRDEVEKILARRRHRAGPCSRTPRRANGVEHGHEHSRHNEQAPGKALQADARVVLRVEAGHEHVLVAAAMLAVDRILIHLFQPWKCRRP